MRAEGQANIERIEAALQLVRMSLRLGASIASPR